MKKTSIISAMLGDIPLQGEVEQDINPYTDPYISKYGTGFYENCIIAVKGSLTPENWADFETLPVKIQHEAIRLWFDEGQIYMVES